MGRIGNHILKLKNVESWIIGKLGSCFPSEEKNMKVIYLPSAACIMILMEPSKANRQLFG
jgi:hypothetical protein